MGADLFFVAVLDEEGEGFDARSLSLAESGEDSDVFDFEKVGFGCEVFLGLSKATGSGASVFCKLTESSDSIALRRTDSTLLLEDVWSEEEVPPPESKLLNGGAEPDFRDPTIESSFVGSGTFTGTSAPPLVGVTVSFSVFET